jgi:hypothetical protein
MSPTNTYLPAAINPEVNREGPKYDMDTAKKEAEMVMCGAVSDLLEKTGEQAGGRARGRGWAAGRALAAVAGGAAVCADMPGAAGGLQPRAAAGGRRAAAVTRVRSTPAPLPLPAPQASRPRRSTCW